VEARESSAPHVEARESSAPHVVAWESSAPHVEAWESSTPHVEAWGNSSPHVVAWESSVIQLVEAWGNSTPHVEATLRTTVKLFGFSVLVKPFNLKVKIEKKSRTCHVQNYKPIEDYFEREGVEIKRGKLGFSVVLFKRVSTNFKTQEGESYETLWTPGTVVTIPEWSPKEKECGKGKFHAVSRPYFGDEFRSGAGDKYIAIEIAVKDTYQWKNPQYPHKISFRKGKVLYECDRFREKVKEAK
jgi:hypothetical protein